MGRRTRRRPTSRCKLLGSAASRPTNVGSESGRSVAPACVSAGRVYCGGTWRLIDMGFISMSPSLLARCSLISSAAAEYRLSRSAAGRVHAASGAGEEISVAAPRAELAAVLACLPMKSKPPDTAHHPHHRAAGHAGACCCWTCRRHHFDAMRLVAAEEKNSHPRAHWHRPQALMRDPPCLSNCAEGVRCCCCCCCCLHRPHHQCY